MIHELPDLPYSYDALEPFIDTATMQLHHDKHHATYVAKLNEALAKHPEVAEKPLEELLKGLDSVPEDIRTAVRNHGGGHLNHSIFWKMMASPDDAGMPGGALLEALNAGFGDVEKFKAAFTEAATKVFGSGWTWLVSDGGKLSIVSTPLQDNPIMQGKKPVLGLDLWEHAYYLKYQNKRPDYITAWWNVVNWSEMERLLKAG
jgi:Fe-Mn family superoxide dismutase